MVAIAKFQGSVSPVFDVSDKLCLIEIVNGTEMQRKDVLLKAGRYPFERAGEMAAMGIEVLLCGAISYALETALMSAGIRVFGFLCGNLETILGAFVKGRLTDSRFFMPGCFGRRQRRRFHCGHRKNEAPLRGASNKRR